MSPWHFFAKQKHRAKKEVAQTGLLSCVCLRSPSGTPQLRTLVFQQFCGWWVKFHDISGFYLPVCHKLGCYSSNIHCLPRPSTPEWYWAWPYYVGWPTECGLKWYMPLPSWDLTSYKVIPPATLGVVNNARTRTGPRNWLVQEEEETWEQTRRQSAAWSSTIEAHLWADWWASNKHLLL